MFEEELFHKASLLIVVESGGRALKRFAFWSQKPFFVTALPVGLAGKKVVHFFLGETPQERSDEEAHRPPHGKRPLGTELKVFRSFRIYEIDPNSFISFKKQHMVR